ncbi:sulfur carrier protein ThiS [Temperatibacter marinus]|uniref:Sulfur carrier protein ThiS n=1 Tax=Temperatibacter marinus TaxID=1456591 RepID=A0AA52H9A1_9PROT|nr:sulfur carrier protein ThiS [Temperatibacter marinus]WND02287.1 sulfur carrier protein ThiS [Temperatibacter marinus]
MNITLNGDPKEVEGPQSLNDLLLSLSLDPKKVAVERNREIVPKSTFGQVDLQDGDQLEIVHFIGGG